MTYTNEDWERFYVRYKAEGLPHKLSIQEFCLRNKVPYRLFDKWYRDTRHKVVAVKVDGRPDADEAIQDNDSWDEAAEINPEKATVSDPGRHTDVRILVDIRMSNGLHLSQRNLSFDGLVKLVHNLEELC